jgi:hypothetical protein
MDAIDCPDGIDVDEINGYLHVCLWDITKIASHVTGTTWSPEDVDAFDEDRRDACETLLVRYKVIKETTKQRNQQELLELQRMTDDLLSEIYQLSELPRSQARTEIHVKLAGFRPHDPIVDEIRELLEPVTMGEKEWGVFQDDIKRLLNDRIKSRQNEVPSLSPESSASA